MAKQGSCLMINAKFKMSPLLNKVVNSCNHISATLLLFLFALLGLGERFGLAAIENLAAFLFLLTILTTVCSIILGTKQLVKRFTSGFFTTLIEIILILSVVVRGFTQAIARISESDSFRVWDLDNLFFVSNARSILAYGDASKNLGILDEPLNYHSAPSFLLAVIDRKFGVDPLQAVFMLDGFFSISFLLIGLHLIGLISHDIQRYRLAFLIALNVPFARFQEDFRIFLFYFWERPSFFFDAMHSSILGLILLSSYWAMMIRSGALLKVICTVCVSLAFLEVKPQFYPVILLIISLSSLSAKEKSITRFISLTREIFIALGIFIYFNEFQSANQVPVNYSISWGNISPLFVKKIATSSPFVIFLLLILITLLFVLIHKRNWSASFFIRESKVVIFAIVLYTFTQTFVAILNLDIQVEIWLSPEFAESSSRNDEQLLFPILFFILSLLLGTIIFFTGLHSRVLFTFACLTMATTIWNMGLHISGSNQTEDFADLRLASTAVSKIPTNSLILTNEFFYPSGDYNREYFGFLGALSNSQFYFSMPGNFQMAPSWSEKFEKSLLFFGSSPSGAHWSFITTNHIDYLLYSKRCKSPFVESITTEFELIFENSHYSVYKLAKSSKASVEDKIPQFSAYLGQLPLYGQATCDFPLDWKIPIDSKKLIES